MKRAQHQSEKLRRIEPESAPPLRDNSDQSAEIERQTREFLSRGGVIRQLPDNCVSSRVRGYNNRRPA